MKMNGLLKCAAISTAFLAPVIWSGQALAGGVTLTLTRSTLINVVDAAGTTQHEGGTVQKGAVAAGEYIVQRRITPPATTAKNTAAETMTIFFNGAVAPNAPNNVTLQGAHTFNSGRFAGSVTGASNRYNWLQGADAVVIPAAVGVTSTLTITWTGSNQLTTLIP